MTWTWRRSVSSGDHPVFGRWTAGVTAIYLSLGLCAFAALTYGSGPGPVSHAAVDHLLPIKQNP
jgi:hypothetical protein